MDLIIQTDADNDACYLGFQKTSTDAGSVAKSVRVSKDVTLDFAADGRLVGLDIMNASTVLGSNFADVRLDSLIGVKEAAALLGVLPPNFIRDHASREDFPKPAAELASGRIWLRSQVDAYAQKRTAKIGGASLSMSP
jgi:uncharacterized protein YuzE